MARETDMTGREPVPGGLTLAREDLTAGLDGYRRLGIDDLIIGPRPVTARSIDCPGHTASQARGIASVIRNPEKRKVGGSTPPLTTHYHQRTYTCELR